VSLWNLYASQCDGFEVPMKVEEWGRFEDDEEHEEEEEEENEEKVAT
jgi:hypothetical protein